MQQKPENEHWKKSEVVIPEREAEPDDLSQADPLLAPATGDSSGGLDGIGEDVKDVVKDSKPNVDLAKAVSLIEIRGREEHVKQFKLIANSQFDDESMGGVQTPAGIPMGMAYTLIGEAQKYFPDLDLSQDKIIITVKMKSGCKKCNGKGHIGRMFDQKTLEITDKLFKCSCLKTQIEVEENQPQENEDGDSDSNEE